MAKPARWKAPRHARVAEPLPVREWAPLGEAFDRVKVSAGSTELAGRQLRQDLLDGKLQGAVRYIAPDATETWLTLEPEWWQPAKISWNDFPSLGRDGGLLLEGWKVDGWDLRFGKIFWFVRRVELHELYPVADLDKLHAVAAPSERADNPASRRSRSGPKPYEDWPTLVAAWLVAEAAKNPEKFRRDVINVNRLVKEAAAFLGERLDWAPDDKDLRARIVSYLRFVRS